MCHCQALANALALASASAQHRQLSTLIQAKLGAEKQNIPALIFEYEKIGNVTVYVTVSNFTSASELLPALLQFNERVEQKTQLAYKQWEEEQRQRLEQNREHEFKPTLKKHMEILADATEQSSVRFILDMQYDQLVQERGYPVDGGLLDHQEYLQLVSYLVSHCAVIGFKNAYVDNSMVKAHQHFVDVEPVTKQERQLVPVARLGTASAIVEEVYRNQATRVCYDVRGLQQGPFFQQVLLSCDVEQVIVGRVRDLAAWARVNDFVRFEEGQEFPCGCEAWVVGLE